MQRWFRLMAFAALLSVVLVGAVNAQAQIQIQVQAQPAQIQIQPAVQAIQIQAADRVAIMPGVMYNQTRLMQADAIFVGRVMAFEPMDIEAAPAPGQANVKYRVAVVEVSEAIHGVKVGTQTVRVAFVPQANNNPGNPGGINILPAIQPVPPGQAFPGRRPFIMPQANLEIGQTGMFAVAKHHKENFFLAPVGTNFVPRDNNPNFENEVKTAKQLSKAMGDPMAALKAEDKQDRYLAAAILITKYRSNPAGVPVKSEPIDAAESKLILTALQGGDWTVGRFNAAIPNPFELFNQLGVNQKDGYNPVNIRNQQDIATAMQKWLDENNGKYVIQKLVADPNGRVQGPIGIDPVQPLPPVVRPPIKLNPKAKVLPAPIKGKVQILPAPEPQPAPLPADPIEIEIIPPQPAPAPQPIRRDDR